MFHVEHYRWFDVDDLHNIRQIPFSPHHGDVTINVNSVHTDTGYGSYNEGKSQTPVAGDEELYL